MIADTLLALTSSTAKAAPTGFSGKPSGDGETFAGLIDIDSADVKEKAALLGIGLKPVLSKELTERLTATPTLTDPKLAVEKVAGSTDAADVAPDAALLLTTGEDTALLNTNDLPSDKFFAPLDRAAATRLGALTGLAGKGASTPLQVATATPPPVTLAQANAALKEQSTPLPVLSAPKADIPEGAIVLTAETGLKPQSDTADSKKLLADLLTATPKAEAAAKTELPTAVKAVTSGWHSLVSRFGEAGAGARGLFSLATQGLTGTDVTTPLIGDARSPLGNNALTFVSRVQASPANPARPEAFQQVADAIRLQTSDNRVMLRLDPPDLGRVGIELSFDNHRLVTAVLTADNTDTAALLRRSLDSLQRELSAAGFDGVNIDFADAQTSAEQDELAIWDQDLVLAETMPIEYGFEPAERRNIISDTHIDARF
ncbi:flagellar hook-length control protein FliK [Parvularcula marina]|uniref:Flagellar hook-length control protein FliK n=1 Tax=Parvularcula marina TaxID=2292771 RepID=A0A371RH15_9PROT|nr:flagellar hook-length control protein FliK [Parvularcula marina]RFB04729.1 flagellar hook-length control protein FliK [Parvularcula marina]